MNIALVRPPMVWDKPRGIGVYAQRLYDGLVRIRGLKVSLINFSPLPFAYQKFDLIHFPYFDSFFFTLPLAIFKPYVVTIPDLTPLIFPHHFPVGLRGTIAWPIQKNLAARAARLITISESAKGDIGSFLEYPQSKIDTTYLAADEKFHPITSAKILSSIKTKYRLPDHFVLYVGGVNWNKNLPILIRACQKINIPLVLAGPEFLNTAVDFSHPELKPLQEVLKLIKKYPKVLCLGLVSVDDLVALYNLAAVYVQPSVYEGFGLPVLEALSCGCPVICGRNSSFPEVGGEAVTYANVRDLNDLAGKIAFVKKTGQELIQAKKFSWAKTARETYAVYQEILFGI